MPNQNTQTDRLTSDSDESGGSVKRKLNTKADTQVRQNEDASLQDDSYAFDEANTDNEEFHDLDDIDDDASDLTDIFEIDDDLQ